MSSPGSRITAAYAISILLHLLLLLVLAMLPEIASKAGAALDPQTAPLEVILQPETATPEPTPTPALAQAATPTPTPEPFKEAMPLKPELTPVTPELNVIRTQLDPANLKRSDKAPENPKFVASYNSVATRPKARPLSAPAKPGSSATPSAPKALRSPAEVDLARMEQALLKKAGLTPGLESAMPKPTPVPLPHAAATAPFFRTSLPKPTPLGSATATPAPLATPAPSAQPSPAASGSSGMLAGETPTGQIGDDDEVGVDAVGKWSKAVGNAVGSCWNFYRQSKADLLDVGDVVVKFTIDANRQVSEINVISNTASANNAVYAVRSVREAEIPPVPPERLARSPDGRISVKLILTIYSTK